MSSSVRIGVIGCGNVLEVGYQAAIERLACRGQASLVAACDRQPERHDYIRQVFGQVAFTTDHAELLERADVDLVLILASMQAHAPLACAALRAGKHVMLEKPIATTLAAAEAVLALARRSPGYLLCAPFVTLSPTFQTIWRRVQRGDIGPVHLARARYGWAGPWWDPHFYQAGGGALFDMAVYNLTTLTALLGPAQRVLAMTGVAIPEREVAGERIRVEATDNAHILLDFGGACFAVVTTGFTMQQYRCPAVELYGSYGTLQMIGDDWRPLGYELWLNDVGAWQTYNEVDPTWPWTAGLDHLVSCIRAGRPPLPTPEHAYHVLELMLAATEAGEQGHSVAIHSTFPAPAIDMTEEPRRPAHLVNDSGRANRL